MTYEIVPAGAIDSRSEKAYTCKFPLEVILTQMGVFVASVDTLLFKAANISSEAGRRFSGIVAIVFHVSAVYDFEAIANFIVTVQAL